MDIFDNHNAAQECSIIIPVYKRYELIRSILKSISKQIHVEYIKDIIICDSEIGDDIMKEVIDKCKPLYNDNVIKHIFVENNISAKRNAGIKEAISENIIFIDDDCIPSQDFIINHVNNINKTPSILFCGIVDFEINYLNNSNYINYKSGRQKRVNIIDNSKQQLDQVNLDFTKIITMNMSCKKKLLLDNNLFFDEDFLGYGMEDNEFGWRVQKCGIQIKKCTARIIHNEICDFDSFCSKIYHLARDGMPKFMEKHGEAAWQITFCKYLEPNYPHSKTLMKIICYILRNIVVNKSAMIIKYLLKKTDNLRFLYNEYFYKYVFAYYYVQGVSHRKNYYRSNVETKEGFYIDIK